MNFVCIPVKTGLKVSRSVFITFLLIDSVLSPQRIKPVIHIYIRHCNRCSVLADFDTVVIIAIFLFAHRLR